MDAGGVSGLSWLPALLDLEDFRGDWSSYEEEVHAVFSEDFMRAPPQCCGKRVGVRKTICDGRPITYWHVISEGKKEDERTPDLRRCERIGWLRPMIEAVGTERVVAWFELADFAYLS